MIKALVYTDLQAAEGQERCYSDPQTPLQRYRVKKFFADILKIYETHGCNAVWDLGDTTDERMSIPWPTLQCVREGIKGLPVNAENIKLTGNHEQYTRNIEFDNRELFNDRFTVVSGIETFGIEKCAVVCCAYPSSTNKSYCEEVKSALLACRRLPTIILGHLDIAGSQMRGGTLLHGVSPEIFDSVKLGLFGHIHKPQQIRGVHYVGSPFQQNFGESAEDKRVAIVTVDGEDVKLDWVPLTGFPRYIEGSLEDFEKSFDQKSEDRWKVYLKSEAEAAKFFLHPFSVRAVPEYSYHLQQLEEAAQQSASPETDFKARLGAWMNQQPPSGYGITATLDELSDCAAAIVES